MKYVLLTCAAVFFLLITFDLFLKEPPVWPDEAGLAKYSVLAGKDPLNYFQYYPSIYIAVLSSWFHTFGSTIVAQRWLSLIAGFFIFSVFFLISKNLFLENKSFRIIGLILLLTDFTYLQSTRVGRPETWTLLLGLISIYFLQLLINSDYQKFKYLFLSIIFALFSSAFHLNGLIYLAIILIVLMISVKKLLHIRKKILIMLGLLSPVTIWIFTHTMVFLSFILLRFNIGNAQDSWIFTVFNYKPLELKLIYLSYIAVSLLIFLYFIRRRPANLFIIIIPLIFSWIILFFNKDFWYAVYLVPFVFLSLIFLIDKTYGNWKLTKSQLSFVKFLGVIFICSVLFLSNIKFHYDILLLEGGDKYSYEEYLSEIQKNIPDGKAIFNSAIPVSYYAFTGRNNNQYSNFPQGFVEKSAYIKALNEIDYIIFNGMYGNNYYGDLIVKYMEKNRLNITKIGKQDQYQAYIVELRPITERTDPDE